MRFHYYAIVLRLQCLLYVVVCAISLYIDSHGANIRAPIDLQSSRSLYNYISFLILSNFFFFFLLECRVAINPSISSRLISGHSVMLQSATEVEPISPDIRVLQGVHLLCDGHNHV
jgi:hypothetical protein